MRTIVTVSGMQAVHCVRAVQTALTMVTGIEWCDVSMGRVEVEHDGRADATLLREAIAVAGFSVTEVRSERRLPIVGEP
ncbi:MAG TPA: heavy-metal-associated domain-containing protein [Gemmatimonadaceae bacterium]|nr:heavy-metal-associated domain-containing protein [Gemmatimonadaceae bacterium]